jgi:AraC-like DNA-binding protein
LDALITIDLALRGASAGSSLILAAALAPLALKSTSARFGALFALSAAAYAIASAQAVITTLPGLALVLKVPAMAAGVFFWWFTLSLFCDQNRWHWSRLIPLVLVVGASALIPLGAPQVILTGSYWGTELINAALMLHVMWIIFNGANDDLVEHRRKFRAVWVGAVALVITAITVMHTLQIMTVLPQSVHVAQAALVMLVSCCVTAYCLAAQGEFFPEDRDIAKVRDPQVEPGIAAADRHLAVELRTLMANGAYTEPGLTVGGLAEQLTVPEHRLRQVINQQLGYRNFAAFLNEYRVGAAKIALSDPAQARRQILQIALDLGYGSIAPFNRAFRATTGVTPTAFRRQALDRAPVLDAAPAE